jgi:beta-glucosidase
LNGFILITTRKALVGLGVFVILAAGCSSGDGEGRKRPVIPPGTDAKVQHLLSKMTLEEKVGQMTQLTLESFTKSDQNGNFVLDEDKLRQAIVEHRIGSILNCGGQARTVANWQTIITQIQDIATKETPLGIPILYGIDSIHGASYVLDATLFPQDIAMAATGDVKLMEKVGKITALETRAAGIPWNFGPVLDVGRQPMWPRLYETFGEDPYIASTMGAAYIKGLQGEELAKGTQVAACMKHYVGYSFPFSGKDRTPAYISEHQLRQIFLKPFAAAVNAGAITCMVNSSQINGIPVHSDKRLLTDILRGELHFQGLVVSDWNDIENLYTREKVAADRQEAVKMAVMAGVDMSMVPYDYSFYDTLLELVHNGQVPIKRINEAVSNILRVKFALGLFDHPYPVKSLAYEVGTDASRQVNLEAAHEALTLLKNQDRVLPLTRTGKVLVTGPCADKLSILNGGWTITWQGDREALYPRQKATILKAIRSKIGDANTAYVEGAGFDKEVNIAAAVSAAKGVDAIVACIGEPPYCEGVGNIDDLTMTAPQLKLVKELAATGKPVILVLVEGRPRVIRTIVDDVKGILMAYLPGMEGGQAVADALFGDVNPSGKLPFTYPKYPGGFTTYDHTYSEDTPSKVDPQWPFGYGLSYTTLECRALALDKTEMVRNEKLIVTVEVANTGDRVGKEIVQLYVSDLVASVTPPVKVLKAFKKIEVKPKQKQTVRFELGWDDFEFIGRDNKPVVEPGQFKISIGEMSVLLTIAPDKK